MNYDWNWSSVILNMDKLLLGLRMTLLITLGSISLGLVLGVFVAAGRLSRHRVIRLVVGAYVELFRGTPALVQLIWFYYCLPIIFGIALSDYLSVVIALTLNTAAFYGEAFRAGIQAIPRDQVEAANVLGLSYVQKMVHVVVPQAFRTVIPVLLSQSISLFKDTSLVSSLGVADLMYAGRILATQNYRPLEVLTMVAFIYFLIAFPITMLTRVLEMRLGRKGGTVAQV